VLRINCLLLLGAPRSEAYEKTFRVAFDQPIAAGEIERKAAANYLHKSHYGLIISIR
jgi:hypothetical protein